MNEAKTYNDACQSTTMAKAEKGITVFLEDEDIIELLRSKKIRITTDEGEIIITYLQGNLIEEKAITPFGKKGYFHIPVRQIGLTHKTAFVVPAEKKNVASASDNEKEVRT